MGVARTVSAGFELELGGAERQRERGRKKEMIGEK
jgi:hypothetical protein